MSATQGVGGASRHWRMFWMLLDAGTILVLLALVACAFWPVYATAWLFITVLGFGGLGIGVAVLARRLGLAAGPVTLLMVVGWLLLGGPLAMPSSTLAGVVPTLRSLHGMLIAPVTAWRDMLTLEPPIGETFNLLAIPGLVALVAGFLAMRICLHGRAPTLAWVPLALAHLVAVAVGSGVAFQPFLVGGAFFLVVVAWTSYRRLAARSRLTGRGSRLRPVRILAGVVVLVVAALAAMTLTPVIVGTADRNTLRAAVEPPIDPAHFASPLQGYRANITQRREDTLFTVTGSVPGDIVRIATLDKYDGVSYRVGTLDDEAIEATTFTRVGQWIADDGPEPQREATITVDGYTSVWVPTLGRTTSIQFEGPRATGLADGFHYNRSSGTGLSSSPLAEGDVCVFTAKVPQRPLDEDIAGAHAGRYALPDAVGVADEVVSLAKQWARDAQTEGAAALALERNLRAGFFSHGQPDEATSLPGHTQRRLAMLLAQPQRMIGDHEQYAVAMALMARELGIPARVIYGYQVGSATNITGDQVGAWPELYFEELGWVVFDPTPPKDQVFNDEDAPKPLEPQPFIENPPPPPQRPEAPPADEQLPIDPGEPPREQPRINWAQIGALFALTGIPFITIVVPIVLIVGLKLRRRAHRRNHPVLANRIAGAWAEVVDRARDIGRSPSASATRTEQAESMLESFPKMAAESNPISLAREADWIVFAPGEPSEQTTHAYWDASNAMKRGMRDSINRVRWLISHLSTKSFRRIR